MLNSQKVRAWATPLTIGAFALSAITGIMIFFHLNFGLIKVAHEWFSWFLVLGGLFHVIGSWESFGRYFSKPTGRAIMTIFVLLIITSFLPLGHSTLGDGHAAGQNRRMPPAILSRALPQASFATVANIAEHQPEELMKELESKGIVVKDKEETIREIAVRNNKQGADILNAIF
jgi:predicted HTH domain antitoxin